MYTAKRPRSVAKSDLNKDLKDACSATKVALQTGHEEPIAKRFTPNPTAIMSTSPFVLVFTLLSVMGYWRQIPDVPETVKAFVNVQQATQSFAPPPPTLPRSIPLHFKGPVDLACRASKTAWLFEASRADFTGEEVSLERLNESMLTVEVGSGMRGTPTTQRCVCRTALAAAEACTLT